MMLGRILSTACAVALIAGCAASQQARDVETSGFLGSDYGLLREGQENEALLVYRNPSANWAAYDKIKLDPVTIWAGEGSGFEDFSQPDRQALADSFYSAIHQELATDYQMVDALGPGVLHVQVALTDAHTSNPTVDTISSVVPQALLISEAKGASDRQARLRRRGERRAKIADGATGELLAAAVDRRVGGKSLGGSTDSWNDVRQSFVFWAKQFRYRLCTERGGSDCQAREA